MLLFSSKAKRLGLLAPLAFCLNGWWVGKDNSNFQLSKIFLFCEIVIKNADRQAFRYGMRPEQSEAWQFSVSVKNCHSMPKAESLIPTSCGGDAVRSGTAKATELYAP